MKKKQILSLLMLCSYTVSTKSSATVTEQAHKDTLAVTATACAAKHKRKKTNFKELEFIKMVDGKHGLFDGVSVYESLQAILKLQEIRYGKKDKTTQTRSGLYLLEGKLVTLKDLVLEDDKLTKEGVGQNDPRRIAHTAALNATKDDFNDKMKALRTAKEESDMAKSIKHKLIAFWLKDQNRETSLMANADFPDEKTKLYAASATEFFVFLNDLSHFLEDMIESCTEAQKQYKELVHKAQTK